MNYSVKLKNGNKAINGKHYTFDEKTKIFKTYVNLIIDFSNYNDITFDIWRDCILKCGDNCIIKCWYENEFYLGNNCLIKDCYRNNTIHNCKPNCQVELYDSDYELINKFFIPTKYKIKTSNNSLGFEIYNKVTNLA